MPMKLNVGVSRKVGLPDYGSVGASCNLELELDSGLLERDLEAFHTRIRGAYVAAHQAVHDELARLQGPKIEDRDNLPTRDSNGSVPRNGHSRANGTTAVTRTLREPARAAKPATPSQLKAIRAIAHKQDADLVAILRQEYEVERPEDLTLRQASALIDMLKGAE
jgi:hypothetical protein